MYSNYSSSILISDRRISTSESVLIKRAGCIVSRKINRPAVLLLITIILVSQSAVFVF